MFYIKNHFKNPKNWDQLLQNTTELLDKSNWLAPNINFNIERRKQAKNEKDFYKLFNNSLLGRTIMYQSDIHLVGESKLIKYR